jgi:urease accessory protein
MSNLARILLVIGVVLNADRAVAHPVFQGATGFYGGLLHPLFVPAHLMVLLALGLLIALHPPHWRWQAVGVYFAALIAGLLAIALAVVPVFANEALLGLALVSGGLVLLARAPPAPLSWLLAGATGLALALDSPPEAISLAEANLTLLGTAIGAVILLLAVIGAAAQLRRNWQRIGARILGSWITASAILVLALRFAR